jgi:monooxygenase
VVVIGSGATAVTLVPELARQAAHVTMLQRSPTYIVSRPAEDGFANRLRRWLPERMAYRVTRWKNVGLSMLFFRLARTRPERVARRIVGMVREQLGPDYDVGTHFTPSYKPWDQRVCLVPDADLFDAIRGGRAEVVTDRIATFTETGLRLESGRELAADVVVAATGLEIRLLGGAELSVDGRPVATGEQLQYKGMMFAGVPNMSFTFGYTNASWTLKADLVAGYACRLLNTMRRRAVRQAMPVAGADEAPEPFLTFTSGYVQRAAAHLPKQGARRPWRLHQNYALDLLTLRFGSVDEAMVFSSPEPERNAA